MIALNKHRVIVSISFILIFLEFIALGNSAPQFLVDSAPQFPENIEVGYLNKQHGKAKPPTLEEPKRHNRQHLGLHNNRHQKVPGPDSHVKLSPLKRLLAQPPRGSKRKLFSKHSKKEKNHKSRLRHINQVPQPEFPLSGDPPSKLAEDTGNKSGSYVIEDSIETQKLMFEAMLDYNHKYPKKEKQFHDNDEHIQLKYDYKNKKYSITEED